MGKSSAKKAKIYDDKKGWVEIGKLSKNELCRGVVITMTENQNLKIQLDRTYQAYGNHLSSLDIMNDNEVREYYGLS